MKYIVNCPLGADTTDEATALYVRLASLLLTRLASTDVQCRRELRSEIDPTQKPRPPLCLPVYTSAYWAVFEFDYTGYSAYIDCVLTDLAEDFGLDFVEWTQDGSQYRKDPAAVFAAAYNDAYEVAA